jgi:hypothetical protein
MAKPKGSFQKEALELYLRLCKQEEIRAGQHPDIFAFTTNFASITQKSTLCRSRRSIVVLGHASMTNLALTSSCA